MANLDEDLPVAVLDDGRWFCSVDIEGIGQYPDEARLRVLLAMAELLSWARRQGWDV